MNNSTQEEHHKREILDLVLLLDKYSTRLDQISKDDKYRHCGINPVIFSNMSELCYLESQKALVVLGEGYESAAHYQDEESKLCRSLTLSLQEGWTNFLKN